MCSQRELAQRLREQVTQLERRREEEQVERATVINTLTQRLEEGQQQCAKLLQTGHLVFVQFTSCQINTNAGRSISTVYISVIHIDVLAYEDMSSPLTPFIF